MTRVSRWWDRRKFYFVLAFLSLAMPAEAQPLDIDPEMHVLRNGDGPEWSSFPEIVDDHALIVTFTAESNDESFTLRYRQQDVKRSWQVMLNEADLGNLRVDENDLVHYLPVPAGALVTGENTFVVRASGEEADDIRVGEVKLYDRPLAEVLAESTLDVVVENADTGARIPARVTIVNEDGALQPVGAASNDRMAVRPGVINTSDGTATFGAPAGTYTVYAGRGFEYSLDSATVVLRADDRVRQTLRIRREVPVDGFVGSDTHIHTWTYSGHGDATIEERMISLASEGIELPIATDHNIHIDYEAQAREMGVRPYFTPVIGNEVTTGLGHFNIFPIEPGARTPDHRLTTWDAIFGEINRTPGVKVTVLNHARDIHSGYRPFGPGRHLAVTGQNVDGWTLQANAMEVINSSAQQTDVMRLIQDWMGLLNRGFDVTPVGSSDSHDIGRYIVGQGRTYIRARDDDPSRIDVQEAVDNFLAGRVMVSLGLLAEITVNGRYGPGDLAPATDEIEVSIRALGPGWVRADRVSLYANGRRLWTAPIPEGRKPGVKWSGSWKLPRPAQDVHLVAVVTGPGVRGGYWPVAKPYQPDGPAWEPSVVGLTGAVWIDGDGDGQKTSAFDDAARLMDEADGDWAMLFRRLARYDEAVASQAASLIEQSGVNLDDAAIVNLRKQAHPATQRGIEAYLIDRDTSREARRNR